MSLIALALFFSIPMLYSGAPGGGDAPFHIRWIEHFTRQFWNGDLYPRWLVDDLRGYGAPIFYFYPPLGYYVAALLAPPPIDLSADLRLVAGAFTALLLSGLACFLWLQRLTSRGIALLGAALYLAAPYHVLVDLYVRTAYSELWSFVWFPLILFSCEILISRSRLGMCGLALAFAALLLSNLPSALIGSFTPFVYLLVRSGWAWRLQVLALAGMTLGMMLAGVALVPALALLDEVVREAITTAERPYDEHFLGLKLATAIPPQAGASFLNIGSLALAIGGAWLLRERLDLKGRNRWAAATAVVGLFSVFLMTPLSQPIWALFPPLELVQFPWRFNTVLSLCSSALLALVLAGLIGSEGQTRLRRLYKAALSLWVFGLVVINLSGMWYFRPPGVVGPERVKQAQNRITRPQHLPLQFLPGTALAGVPLLVADTGPKAPVIVEGAGRILGWRAQALTVEAETRVLVAVPRLYFPGTQAVVAGAAVVDVEPYGPLGMVSFMLEPGLHEVSIRQVTLAEERWGIGMSAVAMVILALILAAEAVRGKSIRSRLAGPS